MQQIEEIPQSFLKFFWFFIKKYKISFFASLFTKTLISEIPYLLLCPWALKLLVDGITNNSMTLGYGALLIFIYTFGDIYFLSGVVNKHLNFNSYSKAIEDMRIKLFNHAIQQSVNFFNNNFSGELNEKINTVITNIEPSISTIVFVISNFIVLFICVIIFYIQSPILGFFIFIWFLTFSYFTKYFSQKLSKVRKVQAENYNKMNGFMTDDFVNISNIKIFANEAYEKKKISEYTDYMVENDKKSATIQRNQAFFNFTMNFLLIGSFSIVCIKMFLDDKFNLGTLFFLINILGKISEYSQFFGRELSDALKNIATMKVGLELITQKIEIIDRDNARRLENVNGKIILKI